MLLLLFVFAVSASGAFGWYLGGSKSNPVVSDNDTWRTFENIFADKIEPKKLGADIVSSGLIDVPKDGQSLVNVVVNGENATVTPPFPDIIGTSVVDGIAQVHLKDETTGIIAVKQGDKLESGWELITVDLTGVTALYGSEELKVKIANYELAPELTKENLPEKVEK